MGRILHRHNEYMVIEEDNKGVVLINTAGVYSNHGHLKSLKAAKMMINLIERRIVPKSDYLKETALRVSLNDKYKTDILNKIEKNKNKQSFININKGIIKK